MPPDGAVLKDIKDSAGADLFALNLEDALAFCVGVLPADGDRGLARPQIPVVALKPNSRVMSDFPASSLPPARLGG